MKIVLALVVLVLNVWAITAVLGSRAAVSSKLSWTLLIVALPGLGFLIWLLRGPGARKQSGS